MVKIEHICFLLTEVLYLLFICIASMKITINVTIDLKIVPNTKGIVFIIAPLTIKTQI